MSPKGVLPPDFADLLAEFESADVRYLIIGGYAVGFHDRPRTTKDLDVLLDAEPSNVERAIVALRAFGAPDSTSSLLAGARADDIVWFGNPPERVDLLLSAPGIDFASAYEKRISETWSGVTANVVSLDDLILSKRAAGRPQDIADVKRLERLRKRS